MFINQKEVWASSLKTENNPVRILYTCLKYDYNEPSRGLGFEHYTFFDSLRRLGHDILYYDFGSLLKKNGRDGMNGRLAELARSEKPDLLFTVLTGNELDFNTIRGITDSGVPTLNWFCDDHWRFEDFSRKWAPAFRFVVTTAASALPKYQAANLENVIFSQWACNHFLYRKLDLPLKYDVTFVGQPHSNRREWISELRSSGVSVHVWGQGWEGGRISQERMIEVFNQSRLNLNFSGSVPISSATVGVKNAAKRFASKLANAVPGGAAIKRKFNEIARAREIPAVKIAEKRIQQIKGRTFEVPGCGGLLLTDRSENLDDYYSERREIVCFDTPLNLVETIKHLLNSPDQRTAIARAGYERTKREHTYAHRFDAIFKRMGLPRADVMAALSGFLKPGEVQEVE